MVETASLKYTESVYVSSISLDVTSSKGIWKLNIDLLYFELIDITNTLPTKVKQKGCF